MVFVPLLAGPLLISLALAARRRLGPAAAGAIGALPVSIGVSVAGLCPTLGRGAAATVALTAAAHVAAQVAFLLAFAGLLRRGRRFAVSLAAGAGAFAGASLLLATLPLPLAVALAAPALFTGVRRAGALDLNPLPASGTRRPCAERAGQAAAPGANTAVGAERVGRGAAPGGNAAVGAERVGRGAAPGGNTAVGAECAGQATAPGGNAAVGAPRLSTAGAGAAIARETAAAAAAVLGVVGSILLCARIAGPSAAGIVGAFPALTSVLAWIVLRHSGPVAAAAALGGAVHGLVAYLAFCVALALTLPPLGLFVASALAVTACLAAAATRVHGVPRRRPGAHRTPSSARVRAAVAR